VVLNFFLAAICFFTSNSAARFASPFTLASEFRLFFLGQDHQEALDDDKELRHISISEHSAFFFFFFGGRFSVHFEVVAER
jgi:hypothetical protein